MIETRVAPTVCFITLGCAKNEADSVVMRRDVLAAGFNISQDSDQADVVVVNTCSFIEAATEESLEVIFDLSGQEKPGGGKTPIIVAGCMPSRYGDDLSQELTEVQAFVPCSKEDDLVEVIREALGLSAEDVLGANAQPQEPQRLSAYIKISDGCDRFCSFCTIPFIRGRYRSFSLVDIVAEVELAIASGTREIVLIAQDTGRWGTDFDDPSSLACLIDTLARTHSDTWFRVMYIQPEGMTDELLAAVVRNPNVCRYFDIPLQHVDEDLLRAMNRGGSRFEFEALIAHIRKQVPGVTLRTTMIAGFPGESEAAFEALRDFVEEADFDYTGVFAYSREDGTRAAAMADQIDEETKRERAQQLRDSADAVGVVRTAARIGQTLDVLVLGREEDDQLYGRAMCQAPEVDGVVYLTEGHPGEIRRVTITDTLLYEMEGE